MVIYVAGLPDHQGSTVQLCEELADLCQKIRWDEDIHVIILAGSEEESFSLKVDPEASVYDVGDALGIKFWQIAKWIALLDQPVIAAISGDATGQGLEAVLSCDVRIAAKKCRFGLPHVQEGVIPWDGGTQRLSRVVGKANALELLLTGKIIDAGEALRIGLVNMVVPSERLMTTAMDMAKEMGSKGPIALRYVKEAVHKGMDLTLDQGLRLEADLYLGLHTTLDRTEGIQAFREKRKPQFRGR